MSSDAVLALVLLGPPALFGAAVAAESWRDHWRRTRVAATPPPVDLLAEYARRRHPSGRP